VQNLQHSRRGMYEISASGVNLMMGGLLPRSLIGTGSRVTRGRHDQGRERKNQCLAESDEVEAAGTFTFELRIARHLSARGRRLVGLCFNLAIRVTRAAWS